MWHWCCFDRIEIVGNSITESRISFRAVSLFHSFYLPITILFTVHCITVIIHSLVLLNQTVRHGMYKGWGEKIPDERKFIRSKVAGTHLMLSICP